MEWVKTTAKTLPEAIDLALDNLGVDESDAEIVVLEEPRTGLFGRIKGTARVEARVKPKQSRPKQERKRNGGRNKSRNDRGGSGRNNGGGRNRSRNKSQNSGDRNRQGKGQGSGRGGQNSGGQNRGQEKQDAADASAQPMVLDAGAGGNQSEKSGGNRNAGNQDASNQNDGKSNSRSDSGNREQGGNRSRGGRNRGGNGGSGGRGKRNSEGNARSKNQTDAGPKVEAPVEDVKNHLQEFLTGLTGAFGFEGPVTVDESPEDGLTGQVAGQHGLMVGPKGRTLDAIQELARISSSRKVPSSVRIKVDVGGYRAQRAVALGQFAVKAADNAVENSVEVALDPMSAADRKAVHDALSDDDRVETRSVGTDPRRKVLVVPVSATANEDDDTSEDSSSEDESHSSDDVSSDDVSSDDVSSDDVSSDEVPNEGDLVEAGTGDADE